MLVETKGKTMPTAAKACQYFRGAATLIKRVQVLASSFTYFVFGQ